MNKFNDIPVEIKKLPQHVLWREEIVNDRPTKVPYCVTGQKASVTDPKTWSTFYTALRVFKEKKGYNGIGVVLTAENGIVGIDFDKCVTDGKVDPTVLSWVERFNSYTEYSPSGAGLHVYVYGKLPVGWRGKKRGYFEVYQDGRYLTETGDRFNSGTPGTIEHRQDVLDAFCREIFPQEEQPPNPPRQAQAQEPAAEVQTILDKAFSAKNGDAVRALYEGDTKGYPSPSEADLALCSQLAFWFNNNPVTIDSVFRASKLFRPKWGEKHGALTYGEGTINKACASCRERYKSQTSNQTPTCETHAPRYHNTDTGNAERLINQYRERIRYNHTLLKWGVWSGTHWDEDDTGKIQDLGRAVVASMYDEACKLDIAALMSVSGVLNGP